MEAALPESLYYVIGVLVVMSAGSLLTAVGLIIKTSFMAGQYKERLERQGQDINKAHEFIREIKKSKRGE